VSFHFSKERKINRLRDIVIAANLEFSENTQNDETTNFYVKIPLAWDIQKNLDWLATDTYTQAKANALLAEFEGWDTKRRKETLVYFTTVKSCADQVLALACIAGRRAHYTTEVRDEPRQPMHSVYIQDGYGRLGGDNITTTRIPYKGKVHCVEVPSGMILVEYQGTPAVCGNTRRGSYAAYLDISHPEIEEFITIRKPTGGDQNRKTTNLHNAVNITDEFMQAVAAGDLFSLRSPKTDDVIKTVRARDLWRLLIETRMQTGEPYMVFIDTINRALPEAQKKLGLKVKQSNLCVAPYTNILTQDGYVPIAALQDRTVSVWNGSEFSFVTIKKTSDKAELVRVWFEDGDYIDCTPDHVFYLADGTKVRAGGLKNGAVLESHASGLHDPIRNSGSTTPSQDRLAVAYTAGWATFAGFEDEARLSIHVPENTDPAILKTLLTPSLDSVFDYGTLIRYEPKTIPSGRVPFEWSIDERRQWLMGAFDAVGDWMEGEPGEDESEWLCLGSVDPDMIREIRLMALEIGIQPRVRLTDTVNALMLDEKNASALYHGTGPTPLQPVVVADVHPLPFQMPTYCATEPKRGRLCFNGYVTGNCTEITLPTGRDSFDRMRTAVCCLSSVNAEKFDDWKDDSMFIIDLMRMLDNALEAFMDKAPTSLVNAVYSAMRERSVGLGLLGFQAYLQSKMVSMESREARAINLELFSHLKREADAASLTLGAERGEAPDMVGTGERFAHKLAVAPNASSSILCGGTSPSIEPHRANAYLHKTLSGSFPVRNPFLVKMLDGLGMNNDATWQSIVASEGSVQHLDIPQDVREVFKTGTELDQMAIVRLAADRAPLICQAQSVNLFFEHDSDAAAITEAHFRAWEWGVKSLYYLRSTTPKRAENTNTKVERIVMGTGGPEGASEASSPFVPTTDEECLSCQG